MTLNLGDVEGDGIDSLSGASPWQPEDHDVFRLAQLTLLFSVASELRRPVSTVERLGYYDFFSANPFVVVPNLSRRDAEDRISLKLAGFMEGQLSYASTGQRWVSRRRRLQYDLSLLFAYGLIMLRSGGFELTAEGKRVASGLSTVYADAFRISATVVIGRLSKLSDRALQASVEEWLGSTWLTLDLLDDVTADSVRMEEGQDQ